MARITQLRVGDVRCFAGEQTARLGRITLLVGPNGAGKSTFLACCQTLATLSNLGKPADRPPPPWTDLQDANHFDDPPFRMGAFETIARVGHEAFSIAGEFEDHCYTGASFTFTPGSHGLPLEHRLWLDFLDSDGAERHLGMTRLRGSRDRLRFDGPEFRFDLDRAMISYEQTSTWLSRSARHGYLPYAGDPGAFRRALSPGEAASAEPAINSFVKFANFFRSGFPLPKEPTLTVEAPDPAPLSRQRLYDAVPAILEDIDEEGRLFLVDFGKKLKLWQDVRIRRNAEARIEIQVGTPSGQCSLADVGYGVASLLPLARAMYRRPPGTTFLLQQPEVHIHPEAQAGLAELMVESNQNFMIETHSDHFTDRFRICVMQERLAPEDLSIVYFEPSPDGSRSTIHSVCVDANANLVDVPDSFRRFFLDESQRLIGFDL